jgi:PIN domain nuclease of toxin-antitoxin system
MLFAILPPEPFLGVGAALQAVRATSVITSALLVQAGRLRLPVPLEVWLQQAMSIPGLEVVPLTVPIIATASRLAVLRDPADMLIVATAQQHGARLVTSDSRIEESGAVQVVG